MSSAHSVALISELLFRHPQLPATTFTFNHLDSGTSAITLHHRYYFQIQRLLSCLHLQPRKQPFTVARIQLIQTDLTEELTLPPHFSNQARPAELKQPDPFKITLNHRALCSVSECVHSLAMSQARWRREPAASMTDACKRDPEKTTSHWDHWSQPLTAAKTHHLRAVKWLSPLDTTCMKGAMSRICWLSLTQRHQKPPDLSTAAGAQPGAPPAALCTGLGWRLHTEALYILVFLYSFLGKSYTQHTRAQPEYDMKRCRVHSLIPHCTRPKFVFCFVAFSKRCRQTSLWPWLLLFCVWDTHRSVWRDSKLSLDTTASTTALDPHMELTCSVSVAAYGGLRTRRFANISINTSCNNSLFQASQIWEFIAFVHFISL